MARVAWIGLGVMGYPMAGHVLRNHGPEITVYNRTPAKADKWIKDFGKCVDGVTPAQALTPARAVNGADFVFSCVGNDDDLREVTIGSDGAFQAMAEGAIFIDNSTTSASVARELANAASDRGLYFIDAPVSGGQAGAVNGALTVMCGGDESAFERALPVISSFARQVTRIGESGTGQLTKMVNQICVAGLVQALSEGIHFAKAANLDIEAVMNTISKGAAQSWQMENRWQTMARDEFEFGFAVDLMRKDLAICLAEARDRNAELPVTELVDRFYGDVQEMGGNRWDTSSLIARLGGGGGSGGGLKDS